MKRARFSEEQIIGILQEAEGGAKVAEWCRRHGISDATFYTWRSKYGGLEISEMRRLRQLEEENRRLKAIVADQALDIRALKDVLAKNGYGPRLIGPFVGGPSCSGCSMIKEHQRYLLARGHIAKLPEMTLHDHTELSTASTLALSVGFAAETGM